jgi:hypothetical protein
MRWRLTDEQERELEWFLPLVGAVFIGQLIGRWLLWSVTGYLSGNGLGFSAAAQETTAVLMNMFFGSIALWAGAATRNRLARAAWWMYPAARLLAYLMPLNAPGMSMWIARDAIHAANGALFIASGGSALRKPRALSIVILVSIVMAGVAFIGGEADYERRVPPTVMEGVEPR